MPIVVGANYYGDIGGPVTGGSAFLEGRGAVVTLDADCGGGCQPKRVFDLTTPMTSGLPRDDPGIFPWFWFRSVVGQNAMDLVAGHGPMMQGRETLYSADIRTADTEVTGVDVYVKLDGKVIKPTNEKLAIRRDSAAFGDAAFRRATITHNFILPPVTADTATLELWLDASKVTGFTAPTPPPQLFEQRTLTFSKPLARPYRICIRPARVVTWWSKGTWPDISRTIQAVRRLMPAMLPVRSEDLVLISCPVIDFDPGLLDQKLLVTTLLGRLADETYVDNALDWLMGRNSVDLTVVVVEDGLLGAGTDAASMPLRRQTVIVDEARPDALIHELGHAAGLNTGFGQEQYDLFPDFGSPLEGITIFSPDGLPAPNPFSSGDAGRIQHHVNRYNRTYDEDDLAYDVMGDGTNASWPLPATARAIGGLIASTTGTVGAPVQEASIASAALTPGMKRVLVTSTTEKVIGQGPFGTTSDFRLLPGTTRAFELGPDVVRALPPVPLNVSHPTQNVGDPTDFDALDANASVVASVHFGVVNRVQEQGHQDRGFWAATFDVPESAVFYRLRRQADGVFPIAVYDASLATRLTAPLGGDTIGASLRVAWVDTWDYRGLTPAPSFVQPLQHRLHYSIDGVAWVPLTASVTGTETTFGTSMLPGGATISLRLTVSDGLRSATARVDNLVVQRRPPGVSIVLPHAGAQGTPDSLWRLDALVWDDDGTAVTTTWSSDRDGELGTSPVLIGIALTAGAHKLTCRATDGNGQVTEAGVDVTVGTLPSLDVAVTADALTVKHAASGPVTSPASRDLSRNHDYLAAVRIPVPGASTTATVRLFLTSPGAAEQLLVEQTRTADAFQDLVVSHRFTTAGDGEYVFRAVLSGATPNADPSNDQRTWRFSVATFTPSAGDGDGDTLPDAWETRFGLDAVAPYGDSGAYGDPDKDGITNSEESQRGTHPRGFYTRYFAEGATSDFFDTELALVNPNDDTALVNLRFQQPGGATTAHAVSLPPRSRRTVDPKVDAGLRDAEFSTVVESDQAVIVDRTMTWSSAQRYGSHSETSVASASLTWYLAEGATHSGFDLFYLLQNPGAEAAHVRVRYLLPAGAPLTKDYVVPPGSRFNIWVNHEEFPEGSGHGCSCPPTSRRSLR